ncbi:hypothetical protein ABEY96_28280 [Priestia aryabhattai]|uniref:hypothetical protein n=1 Tax=Priestia aryabhattai TaxID=412384 RepID=UPI003D27797C
MTFNSDRFEELVRVLEKKYYCPKLLVVEEELNDEQKRQVHFKKEDLHLESKEDLVKNFIKVPAYYTEDRNLPLLGNKFIRYSIDFNKGNLMKITVEKGFWKLKSHDLRFREYIVPEPKAENRNVIYLNYWFEKERWAMLDATEWRKMHDEMEKDLSEPLLRELEIEFEDILYKAASIRYNLHKYDTIDIARDYINIIYNLFWYIDNVPRLWYIFNVYPIEMYQRIQDRVFNIESVFNKADNFLLEKESAGEAIADIDNKTSPLHVLDLACQYFLLEGYEVIQDKAYPSLQTIFTIRKEFEKHATTQTLHDYKSIAVDLNNNSMDDKERDNFVWLTEIILALNTKK